VERRPPTLQPGRASTLFPLVHTLFLRVNILIFGIRDSSFLQGNNLPTQVAGAGSPALLKTMSPSEGLVYRSAGSLPQAVGRLGARAVLAATGTRSSAPLAAIDKLAACEPDSDSHPRLVTRVRALPARKGRACGTSRSHRQRVLDLV
jgi:hypothetical protein